MTVCFVCNLFWPKPFCFQLVCPRLVVAASVCMMGFPFGCLLWPLVLGELRSWIGFSSTRMRRKRTSPTRRLDSQDLKPAFQVAFAEQKHARSACTLCTELWESSTNSSTVMHGTLCFWRECNTVLVQRVVFAKVKVDHSAVLIVVCCFGQIAFWTSSTSGMCVCVSYEDRCRPLGLRLYPGGDCNSPVSSRRTTRSLCVDNLEEAIDLFKHFPVDNSLKFLSSE